MGGKLKKTLDPPPTLRHTLPMHKHKMFRIRRLNHASFYETNLFHLTISKYKGARPMATFTNGDEAVAVFISREEAADILRRKFKNNVDRRIQRSETVRG